METQHKLLFAGIIPARYASSRFPGKPLVMIGNQTMIERVYRQASAALDEVWVATDDKRIFETVTGFGGKAVMTAESHQSGTDRCAEAVTTISSATGKQIDVVVNIQGDEPFIRPAQISLLKSCFDDSSVELATLVRKVEHGEDLSNPNHPKVVIDKKGNAIYFSRSVIPYLRDAGNKSWTLGHDYYKHLGLYAYRTTTLQEITKLERSSLEKAESLEQNRWIENGYRIRTAVTDWESISIDTPADLERAIEHLKKFF